MEDLLQIARCPDSQTSLHWSSDRSELRAETGAIYRFHEGVAQLLPSPPAHGPDPFADVRAFYESEGWAADESGLFGDTKAFVDTRPTSFNFTRKCMLRLNKHFARGGRFLLDAGSGPIAHDEFLTYGDRFQRRICVDLSVQALRVAKAKLGPRALCLQGDLTNLPIKSSTIDAVTCNHVIYQIPAEHQAKAFLELWRVLRPGGVAVVVYWWPETPLAWKLERIARALRLQGERDDAPASSAPARALNHFPLSRAWFEAQAWPFRYRYESFRVISNAFMRRYVSDDWRGRLFLDAVFALQRLAPSYCGKHGLMPTIIFRKD
ncbi:MAG: class I SAM-dependent methyltransferase [Hyphomonadaceae bacterium]|nr:class I SAM-dependent methyltransferase [Hyphomonadaceae bacterium]